MKITYPCTNMGKQIQVQKEKEMTSKTVISLKIETLKG